MDDAAAIATDQPTSQPETFSFCVGHPWPKGADNPDGTDISVYAYGSQVHHGHMTDAEGIRDLVNERTGKENFIYKLVPISP